MDIVEKLFFRFMSTVHICSLDVAQHCLSQILESSAESDTDAGACNLSDVINTINSAIKRIDFEVSQGKCEVSGENFVALVNMTASAISSHAKFVDKKSLNIFSNIIRTIVLSGKGYASDTECLNLKAEASKSNIQHTIEVLEKQQWLLCKGCMLKIPYLREALENIQVGSEPTNSLTPTSHQGASGYLDSDGHIYLGVRSTLELGQLLSQQYPNHVKWCPLCKHVLSYGTTCRDCSCKIHLHCLQKYSELSNNCPNCKAPWQNQGDSSAETSQDEDDIRPSRPKQPRLLSDSD